jgi:predicted Zn finger-like uncharacterized protein
MVLSCSKCEARLQLDEAKAPPRPFMVRCPKCHSSINVQPAPSAEPPADGDENDARYAATSMPDRAFERPASAPAFKGGAAESSDDLTTSTSSPGLVDVAKLLASALHQADTHPNRALKRPAWDRRKVLVCASPAYREAIAISLTDCDYEVFVAENTSQALGRMREDRMDIVILDANFDPVEQGVAFVTREVRSLRPSERRRLFFVYLTSGVRTMDLHAAFLHNVNLVVNPSDVDQLPDALEVSVRRFNELYRDFNRALAVAPI